jgi:radical SAM superfamily enzyme YgiQ (UPF0313 family)
MDPVGTLNDLPLADCAFLGEAEWSFREFVLWIKSGGLGVPPENIRGVAYRLGTEIVVRDPVFEDDLDNLPMPA